MVNSKFIIIVTFLLLFSSLTTAAVSTNAPDIVVTLLSQSPDPVEPGQVVKMKFKIENKGAESKEDVIIKLFPSFPFTVYRGPAEKNLGKLPAGATGSDAAIVEFELKVDQQAVEGDIELELRALIGDAGRSYTDNQFLIDVETHDPILDIVAVSMTPTQVVPGETIQVDVLVKNSADSLLKDIKFTMDFDDLPLAPYQSSTLRRLPLLESTFQQTLSFNLIADPDAAPGLYKIPLNISYNDEKGNSFLQKDLLAITVGGTPKVKAYIKKSSVLQENKAGTITLVIANAGVTNIKYLELKLLPSDAYQLVSTSDYVYIGDVDSDDTESEEFNIFIKNGVEQLHFPIQLNYYDANNKPFQQQFDLGLKLYSTSKLKKFGVIEKNGLLWYVLILILAAVGIWWWRKKKQNGKNKKQSS